MIKADPMRCFGTEQECRRLSSEKRDRSMSDRSRFHTLKEACGIERLAPERRDVPLRERVHWTMVPPACSSVFPRGGLVDPLLRASNEALPRARVPRAGGRPGYLPLPFQSAAEGVPRETEEREAEHFLSPD